MLLVAFSEQVSSFERELLVWGRIGFWDSVTPASCSYAFFPFVSPSGFFSLFWFLLRSFMLCFLSLSVLAPYFFGLRPFPFLLIFSPFVVFPFCCVFFFSFFVLSDVPGLIWRAVCSGVPPSHLCAAFVALGRLSANRLLGFRAGVGGRVTGGSVVRSQFCFWRALCFW